MRFLEIRTMKDEIYGTWGYQFTFTEVNDQNTMLKAIIAAIFAACSADALGAAGKDALPEQPEIGDQMDLAIHIKKCTECAIHDPHCTKDCQAKGCC